MKLFGGNKITGGTATRAELYGLFIAAIVLVGGGVGGAYAITTGSLNPESSQTEQSANPEDSANPEQSAAPATGCFSLPQIPNDNGGSPVGSMEIDHDPTGGKNFEQFYGMGLGELGCKIAEAHDWGDQFSLGLSVNGEKTLMWYSNRVDRQIVESVLRSALEALR